jgi:mono/diheme cytochrome c family protein
MRDPNNCYEIGPLGKRRMIVVKNRGNRFPRNMLWQVIIASACWMVAGLIAPAAPAQKVTAWIAPAAARKVKNPVKPTPAGLKAAEQQFQDTCSDCHGPKGAGDGLAGKALNPKPANFTDTKMMSQATDGELFWKMSTGRGPMPSWKNQLSVTQRWQLVNYIRTLGQQKPSQ